MLTQIIKKSKTEISPRKKVKMKRNHRVGLLIGFRDEDGFVRIGWSAVNTNSEDVFDYFVGLPLATENSHRYITKDVVTSAPTVIRKHLSKFVDRCQRYFKETILVE